MRLALLISLLLAPMMAHAEPVTTAVAVFAAWIGTTAATVYLVAATVVLTTGVAVYGSAQARRAERAARDAARAAMQDRMINRIATEAPHRYIYGRCKVGADIVSMFTSGDRDQYKHLVCVHAAHECDAIEEVYVNNVAVGLRTASGDATEGRYAAEPYADVAEETHVGPSFTLNRYPRAGSVWAFVGDGPDMTEIAVTSASGRNVTVDYTGTVTVSYVYSVPRRFDGDEDITANVVSNPVVRVQVHLGTPDDPADAYLMSVVPDKWKSTSVLRGLCYTVVTLDLNHPEFQNGQVPIHAMIRGRKLYDPRTGNTQWSANPALVIYDYLTSPLCGVPASDLPVAQFITAANVCDETDVPGGRYTINGTVTADQAQATVLEQMAQAMAGGIVSTTWDIYAGKYVAPVAALSQDDIVGAISITPGASDAAIYNGVKGQFISAENNHVLTDFAPYQNAAYRAADGRDLYTNIDFPFTASLQRVHNLARIFTEDQRNGFTLKAEFSLKVWSLKIGQRITFTSAFFGQSDKVYRISDRSYSPNSAVELTLKEDDPSIWDFADAIVADSTPNSDLPDPWAIAPLASLSCTSGEATLLRQADGTMVPRILVSWPAAATQAVFTNGQIEVEWRAVSSTAWSRVLVSGSDTQAYLAPITPGFFYIVRARCVNPYLNTRSDWATAVYQVQVFTARPVAYQWAASQPPAPSGAASYDWGTGVYSAPAGWSLTKPAAPATGDATLWEASLRLDGITNSGTTPFDWASAETAASGYALAADTKMFSPVKAWEFRNTLDGWIAGAQITATLGADSITLQSTGGDPFISIAGLGINGALYGKVRIRLRRLAGAGWNGQVFYSTSGHSWVEANSKTIASDPTIGGAWMVVEWDMSSIADWTASTITGLRVDLGNTAADQFEVDWIAVGKTGPVSLSDIGLDTFRVVVDGSSATGVPVARGIYVNNASVATYAANRSYMVVVIDRASRKFVSATNYDVFGSAANATAMANALNALTATSIVVVMSRDEPQLNRLANGLDAAMYRCGASRMVYGSINFKYRAAYALVGIPGCGEGNGAEAYQGSVDSDTNAWCDIAFSISNGSLVGVTANFIPKSLTDYGYTGDLNATYGANGSNFSGNVGGDNLAINSSFEKFTGGVADGWSVYNQGAGETATGTIVPGRTGGLAQKIAWTTSHTGTKGILGKANRKGWLPGATYLVAVYAKSIGGVSSNSGLFLAWNTAPTTVTATGNPILSASWQRYVFKVIWGPTVEATGNLFLSVQYGSGAGDVVFDDLMIVEGDVLPAYFPSAEETTTPLADTLTFTGVTMLGNTLTKASGSTTSWDASAAGKIPMVGGAYAEATAADASSNIMLGLSTNAAASVGYDTIDYAFYFNSGTIHVFEGGADKGSFGAYAAGDTGRIVASGSAVKYYLNSTLIYTSAAAASKTAQTLYFDTSFYTLNSQLKNVKWGQSISNNWGDVGGTGKPEDNANYIPPSKGLAINVDPAFEKPSGWTLDSPLTLITNSTSTAPGICGRNFVNAPNFTTCADRHVTDNNVYVIDPAKTYSLTANLYAAVGNDRHMLVTLSFYDQNGASIAGTWGSASFYTYKGAPTAGQFSRQGGQFGAGTSRTIPANARTCKIGGWVQYSGSGTSNVEQDLQDLRLEQVIDTVLLSPAVNTALTNFNASNDRNSVAVTAPTIASDGTAVDHTIRTDGAADISFEWVWGGNEGDIDGFIVYVYSSASSAAYSFGTTPYAEAAYVVPANKRAFILAGAAANLYTTFGVQAYRAVDKDLAPSGAIKSLLVKPSLAAENPYRPAANVAFLGDANGTVAGTAASTVVANAAAGQAAQSALNSKPSVTISSTVGTHYTTNGTTSFGSLTANITNGTAPFSVSWATNNDATPSEYKLSSVAGSTTVNVQWASGATSNTEYGGNPVVTITDANGLNASASIFLSFTVGTPP